MYRDARSTEHEKRKLLCLDTQGLKDFTLTALILCMFGEVEGCDSEVSTPVKIAVRRTPNEAVCGFL
jgi:hypothetical protein